VTWHTENRGSRFVSWIKDLATGYTSKVNGAVDALISGGRGVDAGSAERTALFGDVRNLSGELQGSRGNVAKAFHQRLNVVIQLVPARDLQPADDDSEIPITVPPQSVARPTNQPSAISGIDAHIIGLVAQLNARDAREDFQVGGSFKGRDDALAVVSSDYIEALSVPKADEVIDNDDPFNLVLQDVGLDLESARQEWFAEPYALLLQGRLQVAQQSGNINRAEALTIASQVAEEVIRAEAKNIE